jgi:hypothetical protein
MKKETEMRILMKLSIAALLIGMQTAALSNNNYKDLVAEGYRWVNIDGPYASRFEDDAQRLSKNPARDVQLRILRGEGAYYLIEGGIVKVLRTDKSTGMAEIETARLMPTLWTSAKFLSNHPIRDAYSRIETPDTIGWTNFGSYQSVAKDMLPNQQCAASRISSTIATKDPDSH